MVRLAAFAARNAVPKAQVPPQDQAGGPSQQPTETPEAQEAGLVALYQTALQSAAEGRTEPAVHELQAVLSHPILSFDADGSAGTRGTLRELRYLATRNLADQLGRLEEQQLERLEGEQPGTQQQGEEGQYDGSTTAARLRLYGEAVLQQHVEAQVEPTGAPRPTALASTAGGGSGDTVLWQRLAEVALREDKLGLARYALEAGLAATGGRSVLFLEQLLQLQLRTDQLPAALTTCRRLAALDPYHPWLRADCGGGGGGDGGLLEERLLQWVDPQQAALQAFVRRQRELLEAQYGGNGLYGYGYSAKGWAGGDGGGGGAAGWQSYGGRHDGAGDVRLAEGAAAAGSIGLLPLVCPALRGDLPEELPPKRQRLTVRQGDGAGAVTPSELGVDIELPVPAARHAPRRARISLFGGAGREAPAVAAAAAVGVDVTSSGGEGGSQEQRRYVYDLTAVLIMVNRLIRGMLPASDGPDCGIGGGGPDYDTLFGAVLRLAPPRPPVDAAAPGYGRSAEVSLTVLPTHLPAARQLHKAPVARAIGFAAAEPSRPTTADRADTARGLGGGISAGGTATDGGAESGDMTEADAEGGVSDGGAHGLVEERDVAMGVRGARATRGQGQRPDLAQHPWQPAPAGAAAGAGPSTAQALTARERAAKDKDGGGGNTAATDAAAAPVRTNTRRAARGAAAMAAAAAAAASTGCGSLEDLERSGIMAASIDHAMVVAMAARGRAVGAGTSGSGAAAGGGGSGSGADDAAATVGAWRRLWQHLRRTVGFQEDVPPALAAAVLPGLAAARAGSSAVTGVVHGSPPPARKPSQGDAGVAPLAPVQSLAVCEPHQRIDTLAAPADVEGNARAGTVAAAAAAADGATAAAGTAAAAAAATSPGRSARGNILASRRMRLAGPSPPCQPSRFHSEALAGRAALPSGSGAGGGAGGSLSPPPPPQQQLQMQMPPLTGSRGGSPAPSLDLDSPGPVGRCLREGAGVHTVAAALLQHVLAEPTALQAWPPLVRQVLFLEPHVSDALQGDDRSGADGHGGDRGNALAAMAAAHFGLLAALHLDQALSQQAAQGASAADLAAVGAPRGSAAAELIAAAAAVATSTVTSPTKSRPQKAKGGGAAAARAGAAAAAAAREAAAVGTASDGFSGPASPEGAPADGLGRIGAAEHAERARELLARLLGEAVMLRVKVRPAEGMLADALVGGAAGGVCDGIAAAGGMEAEHARARGVGHQEEAEGGETEEESSGEGTPEGDACMADVADTAGRGEQRGAGDAELPPTSPGGPAEAPVVHLLAHQRAMAMYHWLLGHLLEQENRALEAQESYLQCLDFLPSECFAGAAFAGAASEPGAAAASATAAAGAVGGGVAAHSSRDGGAAAGAAWPGCWALPGCSQLRPPTEALVRQKIRSLDIFRTMAAAEALSAAGQHEQVVRLLRDVAFPPRPPSAGVQSGTVGAASAAAAPELEDLPSSAAVQAVTAEDGAEPGAPAEAAAARSQAQIQLRAVQLIKSALMAILQPPAGRVPAPSAPQSRSGRRQQQARPQQEPQQERRTASTAEDRGQERPSQQQQQPATVPQGACAAPAGAAVVGVEAAGATAVSDRTAVEAAGAQGPPATNGQGQPQAAQSGNATTAVTADADGTAAMNVMQAAPAAAAAEETDGEADAAAVATAAAEAAAAAAAQRERLRRAALRPYRQLLLRCRLALLCYTLRKHVAAAMEALAVSLSASATSVAGAQLRAPAADLRECLAALRACHHVCPDAELATADATATAGTDGNGDIATAADAAQAPDGAAASASDGGPSAGVPSGAGGTLAAQGGADGDTDDEEALPAACLPWVRRLQQRLVSYLQVIQTLSMLVEPAGGAATSGPAGTSVGPSRLNSRAQLARALRELTLDVCMGTMACCRLTTDQTTVPLQPEGCYEVVTALATVLCCSRPGLAAAVAAGHVATSPPPGAAGVPPTAGTTSAAGSGAPGAAGGAGGAAATAAAPWELQPFLREALQALQPYIDALGGGSGSAVQWCAPTTSLMAAAPSGQADGSPRTAASPTTDTEALASGGTGAAAPDDAEAAAVAAATDHIAEDAVDPATASLDASCWPGLVALHVLAWREAETEVEPDGSGGGAAVGGGTSEAAHGQPAGPTAAAAAPPDGGATATAAAATVPAVQADEAVPAQPAAPPLADLESMSPLKAAAVVLGALAGSDNTSTPAPAPAAAAMDAEWRLSWLHRLCGAQAQLLWLLFGVDFPWRDGTWAFNMATHTAAAEAAVARDAKDTPHVPGADDALLLWRIAGPHAIVLAEPPAVPGLPPEVAALLAEGFLASLQDLTPTLDYLAKTLPPIPEEVLYDSNAVRFLFGNSRGPDDNTAQLQLLPLLALDPARWLPPWLRRTENAAAVATGTVAAAGAAAAAEPALAKGTRTRAERPMEVATAATLAADEVVASPDLMVADDSDSGYGSQDRQRGQGPATANGGALEAEQRRQRLKDPHWQIHRWLFFCLMRALGLDAAPAGQHLQRGGGSGAAASAASAAATRTASLLNPGSAAAMDLAEDAKLPLADLALNPLRLQSWGALQALYGEATKRLLAEAALLLEVGALEAPHSEACTRARSQLERLWRMAVCAAVAAAQLDPDEASRCYRFDHIASLHYDLVVPCHPLYDHVKVWESQATSGCAALHVLSANDVAPLEAMPYISQGWTELRVADRGAPDRGLAVESVTVRQDWRYQAACKAAGDMWARTAAVLDAEWQCAYLRGMIEARRKAPGWRRRCLDLLAEAAVLAGAEPQYGGGGLLAPLVALHGRRLLWLAKAAAAAARQQGQREWERRGQRPGPSRGGGGCDGGAEAPLETVLGDDDDGQEAEEGEEDRETEERRELLELCGRYCFQRRLALRLHPNSDVGLGMPASSTPPASAEGAAAAATTAAGAAGSGPGGDAGSAGPAAAVASPGGNGSLEARSLTPDELQELLIDDARQALLFAVRSYKSGKEHHHYHPARYLLARCELLLGRVEEADGYLRPLFTPLRGRALFSLNLGRTGDRGFGQQRRKAAAAARAAGQRRLRQQQQQQQQREQGQQQLQQPEQERKQRMPQAKRARQEQGSKAVQAANGAAGGEAGGRSLRSGSRDQSQGRGNSEGGRGRGAATRRRGGGAAAAAGEVGDEPESEHEAGGGTVLTAGRGGGAVVDLQDEQVEGRKPGHETETDFDVDGEREEPESQQEEAGALHQPRKRLRGQRRSREGYRRDAGEGAGAVRCGTDSEYGGSEPEDEEEEGEEEETEGRDDAEQQEGEGEAGPRAKRRKCGGVSTADADRSKSPVARRDGEAAGAEEEHLAGSGAAAAAEGGDKGGDGGGRMEGDAEAQSEPWAGRPRRQSDSAGIGDSPEEGRRREDAAVAAAGAARASDGADGVARDAAVEGAAVEPRGRDGGDGQVELAEPDVRLRVPRTLWATEPSMVVGVGLEESEREHVTAVRKCLALYMRVCWERGDMTTLQAAVPVLYGAVDKMPYIRDLANLAQGLMATGAAETACAAIGLSLHDVAKEVEERNAAATSTDAAVVRGTAEQWLLGTLDTQMQQKLRAAAAEANAKEAEAAAKAAEVEARAAAATAATAAAATEATVVSATEQGAAAGAGLSGREVAVPGHQDAIMGTETLTANGAASATSPGAHERQAGTLPSQLASQSPPQQPQPEAQQQPSDVQASAPQINAADQAPGEAVAVRSASAPVTTHVMTRLAQQQQQRAATGEAPGGAGTAAGPAAAAAAAGGAAGQGGTAGTTAGGAALGRLPRGPSAGSGPGSVAGAAGAAATRTGIATSAAWIALLDAFAPLCSLNLDYWIESSSGVAAAGSGGGGGGGGGSKLDFAAVATAAARVGERYGRPVPGAAAAVLLHESLLRCFSLQYLQALRVTPEVGPHRLQELLRRAGRRHRSSRLAAPGLRLLVRAMEEAMAGPPLVAPQPQTATGTVVTAATAPACRTEDARSTLMAGPPLPSGHVGGEVWSNGPQLLHHGPRQDPLEQQDAGPEAQAERAGVSAEMLPATVADERMAAGGSAPAGDVIEASPQRAISCLRGLTLGASSLHDVGAVGGGPAERHSPPSPPSPPKAGHSVPSDEADRGRRSEESAARVNPGEAHVGHRAGAAPARVALLPQAPQQLQQQQLMLMLTELQLQQRQQQQQQLQFGLQLQEQQQHQQQLQPRQQLGRQSNLQQQTIMQSRPPRPLRPIWLNMPTVVLPADELPGLDDGEDEGAAPGHNWQEPRAASAALPAAEGVAQVPGSHPLRAAGEPRVSLPSWLLPEQQRLAQLQSMQQHAAATLHAVREVGGLGLEGQPEGEAGAVRQGVRTRGREQASPEGRMDWRPQAGGLHAATPPAAGLQGTAAGAGARVQRRNSQEMTAFLLVKGTLPQQQQQLQSQLQRQQQQLQRQQLQPHQPQQQHLHALQQLRLPHHSQHQQHQYEQQGPRDRQLLARPVHIGEGAAGNQRVAAEAVLAALAAGAASSGPLQQQLLQAAQAQPLQQQQLQQQLQQQQELLQQQQQRLLQQQLLQHGDPSVESLQQVHQMIAQYGDIREEMQRLARRHERSAQHIMSRQAPPAVTNTHIMPQEGLQLQGQSLQDMNPLLSSLQRQQL